MIPAGQGQQGEGARGQDWDPMSASNLQNLQVWSQSPALPGRRPMWASPAPALCPENTFPWGVPKQKPHGFGAHFPS